MGKGEMNEAKPSISPSQIVNTTIMTEDTVGAALDSCLTESVSKLGKGAAVGSIFSLLLFKKKLWPVTLGLGIGFGSGYANCQHMVHNPNMIHVSKLAKISPESA